MRYPYTHRDAGFLKLPEWIDETWDFQAHVDGLTNRLVEIAGPTTSGYYWLDAIELPSDIVITNIDAERSQFLKDEERDALITEVADVKQMPWADGSVDMLLCSCLSIVEERQYVQYVFNGKKLPDELSAEWSDRVAEANRTTEQIGLGVMELSNVDQRMLRLSFIREALRVLSPSGVIVVEGVSAHELNVMRRYGLVLRRVSGEYTDSHERSLSEPVLYSVVLSR